MKAKQDLHRPWNRAFIWVILITLLAGCVNKYQIKNAEELSTFFPAVDLKERLSNFRITKDEVENIYFIHPQYQQDSLKTGDIELYIGANKSSQWLRMQITYYGDDWLFAKSYKVAADGYHWQSPKIGFKRDSYLSVWEWIDKEPDQQDLKNLKKLANAKNAIIRFQGQQRDSDFKLAERHQKSILDILDLYERMQKGR